MADNKVAPKLYTTDIPTVGATCLKRIQKRMTIFIAVIFLIYFFYTLNFAIKFSKTGTYFTNNQIIFHNILIWLIPFFWMMILKTLTKPTHGSSKFKKSKSKGGFYESGIGIWGDGNANFHDGDGGDASGGDN